MPLDNCQCLVIAQESFKPTLNKYIRQYKCARNQIARVIIRVRTRARDNYFLVSVVATLVGCNIGIWTL